jgi:hypothetical protein
MDFCNPEVRQKAIVLLGILAVLSWSAAATTISSEDVTIDLSDNTADANINVEKLTSNEFSYVSTQNIQSVNATVAGEKTSCTVADSPIGSEIRCPANTKANFTVNLSYKITETIERGETTSTFTYDHPIYRPTDTYSLKVLLPEGSALVTGENITRQVISPLGYNTGSNGRQILVDWNLKPELGNTLSFYIIFEKIKNQDQPNFNVKALAGAAGLLVLLATGLGLVFYLKREDLSESMADLTDDQERIMEKIRENKGEYLQKDLVDEMDYSKAKISGEVSELVEKGMLKKKKDGRSNKLKIPRKYTY